jgi:hypothetical protein
MVRGGEGDEEPGIVTIGHGEDRWAARLTGQGKHGETLTEQRMGGIDYLDQFLVTRRLVVEGGIDL